MSNEPNFKPEFFNWHGCAWFEPDPTTQRRDPNKAGGWWSVGGQPAQRFENYKQLPEKVVWWTNLSKAEVWALGRWQWFKEGSLFGPDWPALMTESGYKATEESIALAVAAWSETFARCAQWMSLWSAKHQPDVPWEWGEGNLPDLLAVRWQWSAQKMEEPQPVLAAAYQEVIDQEMPMNFLADKRKVVLAFPRLFYAQQFWDQRFGKGPWTWLGPQDWPRSTEDKIAWIRAQKNPLLVRISQVAWLPGQHIPGQLWLGLRGRRFAAAEMDPMWMTGEEASTLATFASLVVDEGLIGEGWDTLRAPKGWSFDLQDPLLPWSWSHALLSTAAWKAAGTPTRDPKRRTKSWVTPRSIWYRAFDRDRCFQAARHLHEKGWPIFSYGNGQVTLIVDPHENPTKLIQDIQEAGLLMPAMLAKLKPLEASAEKSVLEVDHWLKQELGFQAILDIDRLVSPWKGPGLKSLLKEAALELQHLKAPNPEWQRWWLEKLSEQGRLAVNRLNKKED